jgi:hypothetical protein
MWRRYGDALYTLLTLAVFGFETIALGVLSLSFLLGKASGIASTPIEAILLSVVISSASALALLGLYLLSYHFISAMRDRHHADQIDTWTEWWVGLALAGPDEPVEDRRRHKLPRVAVDSVCSACSRPSRARRATASRRRWPATAWTASSSSGSTPAT